MWKYQKQILKWRFKTLCFIMFTIMIVIVIAIGLFDWLKGIAENHKEAYKRFYEHEQKIKNNCLNVKVADMQWRCLREVEINTDWLF